MTSYFDSIFSFSKVSMTDGINRIEYLKACKDLVKIFDYLNATAFAPVKKDLTNNINNLEGCTNDRLDDFIIKSEVEKGGTATCALLWLNRGLHFTNTALLIAIENPDKELSYCFSTAYSQTLSKYHSFVVKPIFSLAMKAVPYRKDFYSKLSGNKTEMDVMEQQKEWVNALTIVVTKTTELLGQS
eukprot:NODE_187_length_15673_cov_0.222743.p6 type:complete len:186 gc:universal NODE_187_length_15673_cov_0.222743:10510-11067(+)